MKAFRKLVTAILLCSAMQSGAGELSDDVPFLLQFTHAASSAAGIGKLAETALADTEQEIRVWAGFGVIRPDHMLRLRTTPDGNVSGEVLIHYKSGLGDMGSEEAEEFRRNILDGCIDLKVGRESHVCTASYRRPPDWKSIYDKLVKLGVLTLPDESALPPPELEINDGSAMVVELREGGRYRAYQYSNSWARSEPEAIAATDILTIVGETVRAADATD